MKIILCAFFLIGMINIQAQENVFLGNDFWSKKTTIEQVKNEINQGNSPTEFSPFNFDATAYAILNHAPLSTIQFLLEIEGNEVSKITHDARNYLMWAAYRGNYELVEILMKAGSDIHIIDDKGNNLQTFTAMGGVTDQKIYELFKEYDLKLDAPNRDGATIIHYLAQQVEDIKALDYFINNGLSLKAIDKNGSSVFHYASSQGNIKLLNQLIDYGLDPKYLNENGENALFFAAKGKRRFSNKVPIFEFLVQLGLDPQLTNASGNNLLHYLASGNKNKEVFIFFMDKDIDVQKVNKDGNTPLMNAAERNNEIAIFSLYEITDDKSLVNAKGHNMLTFALRNKNRILAERLLKEGVDYRLVDKSDNNLITHLVETFNEKEKEFFDHYFDLFKKKGLEIQSQTLHIATAVENEYLVNTLLKSGVDINGKNQDGITALQLAAMKGDNTTFLKFLVEKGANKEIKTEFDESVYDLAKSNELLEGDLEFLK